MDAKICLTTRRSIRKFKPEALPDTLLTEILEEAVTAPTAMNLQPWYFVVVRSPEGLADLKRIMVDAVENFTPSLKKRFADHPEVVEQTRSFMTSLGGAPVCVLAFLLKDSYGDRDSVLQSLAAATENLLLSAWERGVGSCWVSPPQRVDIGPELRERFAPDKGEFIALIPMGWPDQTPNMPPRRGGRYAFA